jgi:hypothetical protein
MSLLKNSFVILLVGLTLSCQHKDEQSTNAFFNVDSLISAQVIYLTELNSDLLKNAFMDGKSDSVFIKNLDTTAWQKELEIFHQLDLNNKPINKENYTIKKGVPDPESDLFICEYTAKNKQPLSTVKIYYQGNLLNPKKIEGEIFERNGLYSSTQHLRLILNEIQSQTLLTHYEITGGQRMILGDSVQFKIKGVITQ